MIWLLKSEASGTQLKKPRALQVYYFSENLSERLVVNGLQDDQANGWTNSFA